MASPENNGKRRSSTRRSTSKRLSVVTKKHNSRKLSEISFGSLAKISATRRRTQRRMTKRMSMIDKFYQMLVRQGKYSLIHLGQEYYVNQEDDEQKDAFAEYISRFKVEDSDVGVKMTKGLYECLLFDPFAYNHETEEDPKDRAKIINLINSRINNKDNTFLQLTEMNSFEKVKIYKDKLPLLGFRKQLWRLSAWIGLIANKIITHYIFETISLIIIIGNSVILAIEDPTKVTQSAFIDASETWFLVLYTIEMVLKILGMGMLFNRNAYLRDPWNVLDFTIVVTAYIPIVLNTEGVSLASLRSLRVLRPLKTISSIRKLKALIVTIFNAIPYLIEIIIVMLFVFLIFAIAGLQLFRGLLQQRCFDPLTGIADDMDRLCGGINSCAGDLLCGKTGVNPSYGVMHFDNLIVSFLMVFMVTTLESWTLIMNMVAQAFTIMSVFYFIILVFIGAFFLLNLTLAVITVKFNESQESSMKEEEERLEYCRIEY